MNLILQRVLRAVGWLYLFVWLLAVLWSGYIALEPGETRFSSSLLMTFVGSFPLGIAVSFVLADIAPELGSKSTLSFYTFWSVLLATGIFQIYLVRRWFAYVSRK
jgi:hypothetical protein